MARNPNLTTQYQNFLKESFEKESTQRLAWFARRRAQPKTKPRQLEVFRKKITESSAPSEALLSKLPEISAEQRYAHVHPDFNAVPGDVRRKSTPVEILPEMRSVSPDSLKVLYDGFTKEEKGRYLYLRNRHRLNPEDKFNFPSLTSMDYGWRLGDQVKKEDIKKPVWGRSRIVQDSFFTRNGIGVAPDVSIVH